MTFRVNDQVRVRFDALLLIGPKLSEFNKIKLAGYLGQKGVVRHTLGSRIRVFFPLMNKAAWFDNDVLEETS